MRYVALIVAMLCVVVVAMGFAAEDSEVGLDPNGDYIVEFWKLGSNPVVSGFNADSYRGVCLHRDRGSLKGSEIGMYDNRLEIRTDGRLFVYNGVYWIYSVPAKSP